jgi:hypothetical protein
MGGMEFKLFWFEHEITDQYRPVEPAPLTKQMKLLTSSAAVWKYW